ncbi:MAG: DUF6550 family protein [Dehalobacterium sp.]
MKKQIIAGIVVIACVALCAAVWPRSAEVGDLPAEPEKAAVTAEIEARSEEMPLIIPSADTPAPEPESVAESEPAEPKITAEKETQKPAATQTVKTSKPSASSSELSMGDVRVVNGQKQIYIDGFGWIEDHSGESVGTFAADMYENGNKIGVMGVGTTVGNPGDINKQVGIMGGGESAPCNPTPPPERLEQTQWSVSTSRKPRNSRWTSGRS